MTPTELLSTTSRTFGLAIPLLPEPVQSEVTLAYLLLRIADTLEDAELWGRDRRCQLLGQFDLLLAEQSSASAKESAKDFADDCAADPPCPNRHYQELLARTPEVLAGLAETRPDSRAIIVCHVRRSVAGMIQFLQNGTPAGCVELTSLDQLAQYCYVVAGIVGEMLTELFCSHLQWAPRPQLQADSVLFGEGLQLVNILKDSDDDARCGRVFLPRSVPRDEVLLRARADLSRAEAYVRALSLSDVPAGILAFTWLPLRLAHATLDHVQQHGAGAKIPRAEVERLMTGLRQTLDAVGRDSRVDAAWLADY